VLSYIGIVYFQRKQTSSKRDSDSTNMHDEILKLKFKVTELEGIANLHRDKLDSIDKQLAIVNQELVKLNCQVENLVKALEMQNEIMKGINKC
jgi:hypothetical protein